MILHCTLIFPGPGSSSCEVFHFNPPEFTPEDTKHMFVASTDDFMRVWEPQAGFTISETRLCGCRLQRGGTEATHHQRVGWCKPPLNDCKTEVLSTLILLVPVLSPSGWPGLSEWSPSTELYVPHRRSTLWMIQVYKALCSSLGFRLKWWSEPSVLLPLLLECPPDWTENVWADPDWRFLCFYPKRYSSWSILPKDISTDGPGGLRTEPESSPEPGHPQWWTHMKIQQFFF